MRALRYLNEPFCQTLGIPYGPIVEQWALIAEAAENEAQTELSKQARAD